MLSMNACNSRAEYVSVARLAPMDYSATIEVLEVMKRNRISFEAQSIGGLTEIMIKRRDAQNEKNKLIKLCDGTLKGKVIPY